MDIGAKTSENGQQTGFNQINSYFRRFTWFTLFSFAIVFSIILFLAYTEFVSENERKEFLIRSEIQEKAEYIDNLIGSLSKSVDILSSEAENYYVTHRDNDLAKQNIAFQYLEQTDSTIYSMNHAPDSLRTHISALTGIGNLKQKLKEKAFARELGLQFHLGGFLSSIMKQHPDITWIYAISDNHFVNYFPFSTTNEVLYTEEFHTYDIYKSGTPNKNPQRKTYITPVYPDAVGKGLMISIGKPYYEGNIFRGIVGVDVTLSFLSDYLHKASDNDHPLFLSNEYDQLLAHSGTIDEVNEIKMLSEIFEKSALEKFKSLAKFNNDENTYYSVQLSNVPWKLTYTEPKSSFAVSALNGGYLTILFILLLLVSLLIYFSFKTFIYPAHKLVVFIDHQSRDIECEITSHPAWRNWFIVIGESFAKNRDAIRLLDGEVRKKTAELLEANKELEKQKASLTAMNQLKDKIFSIVSHDLRSPIHSLVSILGILRKGFISNDEFGNFINQLESNTKQAKFMLENILQWSLSNLNAKKINSVHVDIKEALQEHFDMLGSIADLKHINLQCVSEGDLVIKTDKGVLDLVLRNLLFNALKFSHENSDVCVSYKRSYTGIEFQVKDSGKGMNDEIKSKIFIAGQGIQYGTSNERGTGLGLSLCKEFLEKVGGKIWFESIENKGTTFSFFIPEIKVSIL